MKKTFLIFLSLFLIYTLVFGITISASSVTDEAQSGDGQSQVEDSQQDGSSAEDGETNGESVEVSGNEQDNTQQQNQSSQSEEVNNSEKLIIRTSILNSTEGKIEGSGGMTMIKGDVEINAERGIFHEEDDLAEISENVLLTHIDGEITSEEMEAYIKEDRYVFRQNVNMTQQLDDGQFTLESPYLELFQEDNSFEANQGVVINYNERTLKGDDVFYDDQEQTLELVGNVYIEEEDGDWVESNRAIFYLETEQFTAEGDVSLELEIEED
ncbi:MAG: LptA/OstA family protein [Halanaerobiaceae bacterium]